YLAAVITIVSGADYFLNFRRRIEEARHRHSHDAHDAHERNGGPPREPVGSATESS
ncbi:MAG: hypothetical protein QOG63_843, partial [Thermoleophilaceae bacterium]|nr:hypothetical protein [Thermoleophilaceae bacterium]